MDTTLFPASPSSPPRGGGGPLERRSTWGEAAATEAMEQYPESIEWEGGATGMRPSYKLEKGGGGLREWGRGGAERDG